MKKLRWVVDEGFWETDVSTPRTLQGEARAVPGDPLPLGISRGTGLSRAKQIQFFHRFMSVPLIPSFSTSCHGFSLQRALSIPLSDNWFAALLGQFNLQGFFSSLKLKHKGAFQDSSCSPPVLWRSLLNKSLYAIGFCSELSLTPDNTFLFSFDTRGDDLKQSRTKAIFNHKFQNHNFTLEAAWPALFSDNCGNYWDVPFSMSIDLASVSSDLGASYHLCMQHNVGRPAHIEGDEGVGVPTTLLRGMCLKGGLSFKKSYEIWRSSAKKLKMVQPFDIFLSNPHVSASGIIGTVLTACVGGDFAWKPIADGLLSLKGLHFHSSTERTTLLADTFSSFSITAQHGNFQKQYFDLTRFHLRLDFPSGSRFLSGISQLAEGLRNFCKPETKAIQAIYPKTCISLRQQVVGPFSVRVDSGVGFRWEDKKDWPVLLLHEPVFAVEYALKLLGSARAIAWYSPKLQEFMVELRFFETQ